VESGHVPRRRQLAAQDHLQRHDAIQAHLPGLVDDDLQQLVIAEITNARQWAGLVRPVGAAGGVPRQAQLGGLAVEAVEVGAEAVGQLGVSGQQGRAVGHDAGLDLLQECTGTCHSQQPW
jgi:hypothetical protein